MYDISNLNKLLKNQRNHIVMNSIYPKFVIRDEKENIEYFEIESGEFIALPYEYNSNFKVNKNKKEVIFVIGIGSIDEIRNLNKQKNKDSILIIIEPQVGFFTHVLNSKNISSLAKEQIYIFVDSDIKKLQNFINKIMMNTKVVGIFKNINVYLNRYYRHFDLNLVEEIINLIKYQIKTFSLSVGNDASDSIMGLHNHLQNLPYLMDSKNPAELKDILKDKPAVVVAAGPSLNKNIHLLKSIKDYVVISAVDTIAERLRKEGIEPDFVCSVERTEPTYEYFYKDKEFAEKTTLVAPSVVSPNVFKTFKNNTVIPLRTDTNEAVWLKKILNQTSNHIEVPMGISCAHMAFGIVEHLGCSPIVLLGQDLAYDQETGETHAKGTWYDKNEIQSNEKSEYVEGYYENKVKTTEIWISFKKWFEFEILNKRLFVINATEGGAKIYHTEQMTLQEFINSREWTEKIEVLKIIQSVNQYNIDKKQTIENLSCYIEKTSLFLQKINGYFNTLADIEIKDLMTENKMKKINKKLEEIYDVRILVYRDDLLLHNTQSLILELLWNYHDIEEILIPSNLKLKKKYLGRYLASTMVAVKRLIDELEVGKNQLLEEV